MSDLPIDAPSQAPNLFNDEQWKIICEQVKGDHVEAVSDFVTTYLPAGSSHQQLLLFLAQQHDSSKVMLWLLHNRSWPHNTLITLVPLCLINDQPEIAQALSNMLQGVNLDDIIIPYMSRGSTRRTIPAWFEGRPVVSFKISKHALLYADQSLFRMGLPLMTLDECRQLLPMAWKSFERQQSYRGGNQFTCLVLLTEQLLELGERSFEHIFKDNLIPEDFMKIANERKALIEQRELNDALNQMGEMGIRKKM